MLDLYDIWLRVIAETFVQQSRFDPLHTAETEQTIRENILDWLQRAPFALENHPTPEHLMPLFFAYGAAGKDADAKRLHSSTQYGFFQSDVWAFQ